METTNLKQASNNLACFLGDINGNELSEELTFLSHLLPNDVTSPAKVLQYVLEKDMKSAFPNTSIALRMLLTVPVTVASAERSFSKLSLIKKNLRSTMSQERLSALAVPESKLARQTDYQEVIAQFTAAKVHCAQL